MLEKGGIRLRSLWRLGLCLTGQHRKVHGHLSRKNDNHSLPRKVAFALESPSADPFIAAHSASVHISGWAIDENGEPPGCVYARLGKRRVDVPSRVSRPDVKLMLSKERASSDSIGFEGTFRVGSGIKYIRIIAEWSDGTRYLLGCRLVWNRHRGRPTRKAKKAALTRCHQRNAELRQLYQEQAGPASANTESPVIDIIIPVYRGLGETRACLNSLYRTLSYNQTECEIVVIDDDSPEEALKVYLQDEARQGRITLLVNEQNRGFVATVNRGISLHPDRDVILLNSDTEVYHDWLDRMRAMAMTHHRLGTLTPFSNNATLCSYPENGKDNPLPDWIRPDRLDAIFRDKNKGRIHDIPTGVGFCFYIKRALFREIGFFDEVAFGRGYGEENDFCQRAIVAGWRNVHLCDTFVYHKGAVSFMGERHAKVERALSVINQLYPDYDRQIQDFFQRDPARKERFSVDEERLKQMKSERILCISNSRGGGTLKHIIERAEFTGEKESRLLLRIEEGDHYAIRFLPDMMPVNTPMPGLSYKAVLAFCRQWKITRIEYHHLADQPAMIMSLASDLGLAYTFIAHDYFSYCPQITLTRPDGTYCGEPAIEACEACLRERPVNGIESVKAWRAINRSFLNGASQVICPSQATARHFGNHFDSHNLEVIPHREKQDNRPKYFYRKDKPNNPVKVVGVIGSLSKEKGALYLERVAIDAARRNLPLRFVLFGHLYCKLETEPAIPVTVTGAYTDDTIDALLKAYDPDLFWFPALWPETYCYALSLVMERHYPILVPNIGAFPERTHNYPQSQLYQLGIAANTINDKILSILSSTPARTPSNG